MADSTRDTRSRIQQVALELFTEHGYDKTSLREIAERLGVTKAALYYHFRSKDDIVNSLAADRIERLDELIAWGRTQPADAATRRELLRRYAEEFFCEEQHPIMKFFEQNQTVLKSLTIGQLMHNRLAQMAEILVGPSPEPAMQVRATLALIAVHSSRFSVRTPEITASERQRIALEIANELLDRIDPDPTGSAG